jgi:3-keto-disaccharide hydrolase
MRRHALLIAPMLLLAAALPLTAQPDGEWVPLWNGQDLSGWEHVGPGTFAVENGALKTEGGMGLLWYTPKKVGNAVVRVVFKPEKADANAGVFIRIPSRPTEPWMPVHKGYEVQIDDSGDDYHVTGVLYSFTKAQARPTRAGEWNTMEITLDGPRTIIRINGKLVTDFTEGGAVHEAKQGEPERGPRPEEGYIGLQNHSDRDKVWFKEVSVRRLR